MYEAELWYKLWGADGHITTQTGSREEMLALAKEWAKKYSSDYVVTVQAQPIFQAYGAGTAEHEDCS